VALEFDLASGVGAPPGGAAGNRIGRTIGGSVCSCSGTAALNYFYTVRSLVKRGVVSPAAALSVPAYANVMACVVEFVDFFSAYGKVGVDDRVFWFSGIPP
jgi:hypothetical protein